MRICGGDRRRGLVVVFVVTLVMMATTGRVQAAGDPDRGAQVFGVCAACHSLRPGFNMTGPSLAGVWGREAGGLKGFDRYSSALKHSGVVWDENSLNTWLMNPPAFIPGSQMPFRGIPNDSDRTDLIAFLHAATTTKPGGPMIKVPAAYTDAPMDLKQLPVMRQVKAVRVCRDSYFVETKDGQTRAFWDRNLRFRTDASAYGPQPATPVILPTGMLGDRASLIFAKPEDISPFIEQRC